MNDPQKEEIQAQFLEEALDYLEILESELLGLSRDSMNSENIDQMLRAAHSLKGGAALMEYSKLSDYAHRLEDFFKILKIGKVALNDEVGNIFLTAVDCLGELVNNYRQKQAIDSGDIEAQIESILTQLHQYLGDFNVEDEQILLAQNAQMNENDMSIFLFGTEVEEGLTRLENLRQQEDSSFDVDFSNFLIELSGLAQMLDLYPVAQLCESIELSLQEQPQSKDIIIESALQQLRRSQALVLAKQTQLLPSQLILNQENQEVSLDFAVNKIDNSLELSTSILAEDLVEIESLINQEEQPEEIVDFISLEKQNIDSELIEFAENIQLSTHKNAEEKETNRQEEKEIKNIRIPINKIKELETLFNELSLEKNGLNLQLKQIRYLLDNLRYKLNDLEKNNFQLRTFYDEVSTPSLALFTNKISEHYYNNAPNIPSDNQSFDLLEMDKYNDLHLLAGEMMENIVQIQELRNDLDIHLTDAEKIQRDFQRTSKLMQKNLTEVTMRPLSDLLQKFPRALRQMEIEYGKQVNFQIKGGSTLLEKTVLEKLNDPLLHLFRNAFDHGIEMPEIRTSQGKSPQGMIEISAAYRGNKTVITIRDDGKGIDLKKIITKVKDMGLDDNDLEKISEKELLDLIFEPGFSTSAQVTDLSGRGVGLDVVKSNIEKIGGEITVNTQLGMGTTFILSVPFTLSVLRILLVEVNNMLLAFPSNSVSEVELLGSEYVTDEGSLGSVNWQDEQIKLINLGDYLQFNYTPPNSDIEGIPLINQPTMLMIEKNDNLIGLKVDRYWGEQEVTIRQVENYIPLPQGFSGCTILGDGQIVPLVDTLELLTAIETQDFSVHSSSLDFQQPQSNLATNNNPQVIMVVDDSINVRRFLALTLEKENYQVEEAKDGQEALEKLQSGIDVQAVICDVEMPRLDGFGFLANVKNDPNLQQIPVMMLTSRSGEKHRKIAASLGANSYFSKPFQEQELLKKIDLLIGKKY